MRLIDNIKIYFDVLWFYLFMKIEPDEYDRYYKICALSVILHPISYFRKRRMRGK